MHTIPQRTAFPRIALLPCNSCLSSLPTTPAFPQSYNIMEETGLKTLHFPDQGQSLFPACLSNLFLWPLVMDVLHRSSTQVLHCWRVPQSNLGHYFFTFSSQALEQIFLFSSEENFQVYLPLFVIFSSLWLFQCFSSLSHIRTSISKTDKGRSQCVFHQQA